MADGTTRAIEAVGSGDLVMAFDPAVDGGRGALVPKRVTRTFVTPDQPLIDLHGLRVTPGHEFLCGDGRFRTIKDILDSDGTIVNENGEVIRARTGFPIASKEDQVIPVGFRGADGAMCIGYMRAGTPYAKRADDGRVVTIAARMVAEGFHLHADGRFRNIEGDHVTAFWEWGVPDERLFVAPAEVCADFSFVSAEAGGALAHCQVSRTNEGNRAEPRAGISASRKASNTQ